MTDTPHIERLEGAFRFKRFTVRQDRCAMKVGTDGVLLGAWAAIRPSDRRMLDIGTGTGLIALMLAQRAPEALITGIDIDDVTQARENGEASPWGDRLQFVRTPVQRFAPAERFDLIVSNPPFYVDSLTCPDAGRTAARHAVHLPYGELIEAVIRLLAPGGRFAVVLPTPEGERFRLLAADRLMLTRCTTVRTTPRRPAKRILMEFSLLPEGETAATSVIPTAIPAVSVPTVPAVPDAPPLPTSASPALPASPIPLPETGELVIGTGEHECYTPEYRALTGDFYLKF